MLRSHTLNLLGSVILAVAAASLCAAQSQMPQNDQDEHLDVRSSVGDLHLGKDANAEKVGLPLYPGARPKTEKDNDPLNFGVFAQSFGFKIVIAKYESDDQPAKITDFYRRRLKKYGKVLECHTIEHGGDAKWDSHDDDKQSKQLKCEGDNAGPVTELKVGTEDNQRVVAIEPGNGAGSSFTLVYLYARGKQGDI